MVWVKRPSPGQGAISAKDLYKVIGKVALKDIDINKQVLWSDING